MNGRIKEKKTVGMRQQMRETFIVSLFFWATLDLEHLISVVSLNCGLYLSRGASKFESKKEKKELVKFLM